MDLTLNGSFSDVVLLPSAGVEHRKEDFLFMLTNPGQLQVYDNASLSAVMSQQSRKTSAPAVQYPMVIPTVEPNMTVAKLGLVFRDGEFSRELPEVLLSCYNKKFSIGALEYLSPLMHQTKFSLFKLQNFKLSEKRHNIYCCTHINLVFCLDNPS